jgi:hypothetical protein
MLNFCIPSFALLLNYEVKEGKKESKRDVLHSLKNDGEGKEENNLSLSTYNDVFSIAL